MPSTGVSLPEVRWSTAEEDLSSLMLSSGTSGTVSKKLKVSCSLYACAVTIALCARALTFALIKIDSVTRRAERR